MIGIFMLFGMGIGNWGAGNVSCATEPLPEVVIDFELSPAGDFQAKTNLTSGYAFERNGVLGATPIQVSMGSFKTGVELRDAHMKQRLETTKFPFAKMSEIQQKKKGKCTGLLEYRSFKKKVDFTCEKESNESWIKAEMKLSIPEFHPQGELQYMGVGVEDEVTVRIRVPIRKLK
jgi:hypothetical protein